MPNQMPEGMKTTLGWVLGVAIIAFVLLIMVIIFGNLQGNVGFGTESTAFINETITLTDATTGATPATAENRVNGNLTNVVMSNATDGGGEFINSDNYTISGVLLIATATSEYNATSVNVSATVTYDEQGKIDSDNLIVNYTKSATNTSAQFPTVGTIIGIAVLLAILIGLLIFAIRKMMGVSGFAGGMGGKGSSKFSGSDRSFS